MSEVYVWKWYIYDHEGNRLDDEIYDLQYPESVAEESDVEVHILTMEVEEDT